MLKKIKTAKLDAYTDQLDQWFDEEKITAVEAARRLNKLGCDAKARAVSYWRRRRQNQKEYDQVLENIIAGAEECQELRRRFEDVPAPDLPTLIKLHRVLIYQLSTKGEENPVMLKAASSMFAEQMHYERLKLAREKVDQMDEALKLSREKFEFSAAKACEKKLPELKEIAADNGLTEEERINAIRLELFGSTPK